jgi:hypothetical protein
MAKENRSRLFTAGFLSLLGEAGVASVKLPPRSPNFERACGTVCTDDQVIVWSG